MCSPQRFLAGLVYLLLTLVLVDRAGAQMRPAMMPRPVMMPGNSGMGMVGSTMVPAMTLPPIRSFGFGGTFNSTFPFGYRFANRMSGYGSGGGYGPTIYLGGGYGSGTYGTPNAPQYPPASKEPVDPPAVREQKLALLREQVERERLANRRKEFDEQLYERESAQRADLARRLSHPATDEILSGQALNDLLDKLRAASSTDDPSSPNAVLPLDRSGLQHINLAHGAGNAALLKHGGRFAWPAALATPDFREPRDRLTNLGDDAVAKVQANGRVAPAAIRQMNADLDRIEDLLKQQAYKLSFEPFTDAKRFVRQFREAVAALERPDAASLLSPISDLRAHTVLGLVKQMNAGGWRFAPALPGDESAYLALREAMAACCQVGSRSR